MQVDSGSVGWAYQEAMFIISRQGYVVTDGSIDDRRRSR
jgi:hypothetical protein